jgi:arginine exporter protein ArgO
LGTKRENGKGVAITCLGVCATFDTTMWLVMISGTSVVSLLYFFLLSPLKQPIISQCQQRSRALSVAELDLAVCLSVQWSLAGGGFVIELDNM